MDPRVKAFRERIFQRIVKVARASKRLSLRELQRRTHYNRGAVGVSEPIAVWFELLDILSKRGHFRFENASGKSIEVWDVDHGERVFAIWSELPAKK